MCALYGNQQSTVVLFTSNSSSTMSLAEELYIKSGTKLYEAPPEWLDAIFLVVMSMVHIYYALQFTRFSLSHLHVKCEEKRSLVTWTTSKIYLKTIASYHNNPVHKYEHRDHTHASVSTHLWTQFSLVRNIIRVLMFVLCWVVLVLYITLALNIFFEYFTASISNPVSILALIVSPLYLFINACIIRHIYYGIMVSWSIDVDSIADAIDKEQKAQEAKSFALKDTVHISTKSKDDTFEDIFTASSKSENEFVSDTQTVPKLKQNLWSPYFLAVRWRLCVVSLSIVFTIIALPLMSFQGITDVFWLQFFLRYMLCAVFLWLFIYVCYSLAMAAYGRISSLSVYSCMNSGMDLKAKHSKTSLIATFVFLLDAFGLSDTHSVWKRFKIICIALIIIVSVLFILIGSILNNGLIWFIGSVLLFYYLANILYTCKPRGMYYLWKNNMIALEFHHETHADKNTDDDLNKLNIQCLSHAAQMTHLKQKHLKKLLSRHLSTTYMSDITEMHSVTHLNMDANDDTNIDQKEAEADINLQNVDDVAPKKQQTTNTDIPPAAAADDTEASDSLNINRIESLLIHVLDTETTNNDIESHDHKEVKVNNDANDEKSAKINDNDDKKIREENESKVIPLQKAQSRVLTLQDSSAEIDRAYTQFRSDSVARTEGEVVDIYCKLHCKIYADRDKLYAERDNASCSELIRDSFCCCCPGIIRAINCILISNFMYSVFKMYKAYWLLILPYDYDLRPLSLFPTQGSIIEDIIKHDYEMNTCLQSTCKGLHSLWTRTKAVLCLCSTIAILLIILLLSLQIKTVDELDTISLIQQIGRNMSNSLETSPTHYGVCELKWGNVDLSVLDLTSVAHITHDVAKREDIISMQDQMCLYFYGKLSANMANGECPWKIMHISSEEPLFIHMRHAKQRTDVISMRGTESVVDSLQDFNLFNQVALLQTASWILPVTSLLPWSFIIQIVYYLSVFEGMINTDVRQRYDQPVFEYAYDLLISTDYSIDSLYFVGHSLGGSVSQAVAAQLNHAYHAGYIINDDNKHFISHDLDIKSLSFASPGLTFNSRKFSVDLQDLYATATLLKVRHDAISNIDVPAGFVQNVECEEAKFYECHKRAYVICELGIHCGFSNAKNPELIRNMCINITRGRKSSYTFYMHQLYEAQIQNASSVDLSGGM